MLLTCPRTIKEYGCLTKAVFNGETLVATYNVNFTPEDPNDQSPTRDHLHLFTAKIESGGVLVPRDSTMQMQNGTPGGNWWTAFNPPQLTILANVANDKISSLPQRLDLSDPYLCARVAHPTHMLVVDPKTGYRTGNCVPITKQ